MVAGLSVPFPDGRASGALAQEYAPFHDIIRSNAFIYPWNVGACHASFWCGSFGGQEK